MTPKKKMCAGCDTEQYIWKRHLGDPFCKSCWSTHESKNIKKPTVRKEIPRVSKKRKKQDAEYLKIRMDFLNENKMCQAKLPGCSSFATDVHHTKGGSDRAKHYLDVDSFMAVCRACHNRIHNSPAEARELGYLK
jgi:hypothetical protein